MTVNYMYIQAIWKVAHGGGYSNQVVLPLKGLSQGLNHMFGLE